MKITRYLKAKTSSEFYAQVEKSLRPGETVSTLVREAVTRELKRRKKVRPRDVVTGDIRNYTSPRE